VYEGAVSDSFFKTVADFELSNAVSEAGGEISIYGRMDIDPVGANAGLATTTEFANDGAYSENHWYSVKWARESDNKPSTASSISASSKTMNGAFPPASRDILINA